MSEPLISVKGVSKRYCRNLRKSLTQGVEDIARECLCLQPRKGLRDGEFWANRDISFDLRRGECLGLIGGNGAGKSTLLKMLAGLTKPDEGEIHINGRVGALIELGAGFNPLLSGRENVYVNGAVLGMGKKEVDRKLDSILEFADIGEFIDAPVQSYSSGMKVRLGFAVAVHMEPDILLIDEVLAVGDTRFRFKCLARIQQCLQEGMSIIFVSHNEVQVVRTCSKGLLLRNGVVVEAGHPRHLFQSYLRPTLGSHPQLSLPSEIQANTGEDLAFSIELNHITQPVRLVIRFDTVEGGHLFGCSTYESLAHVNLTTLHVNIPNLPLMGGQYSIFISCYDCNNLQLFEVPCASILRVTGPTYNYHAKGSVGHIHQPVHFTT